MGYVEQFIRGSGTQFVRATLGQVVRSTVARFISGDSGTDHLENSSAVD